ncbi:MAG: hypothetical protein IPQ09_17180 [Myxococcales bacterium]|nr:hypothetical protein [Myxococcales bacterium]
MALVVALGLAGCSRGAPPEPAEAGAARAATPALDTAVFVVAADLRDSARVPASALASRSDAERRLAARSYARIADEGAEAELVKLLADADPEVVSWAAYGLGYTCKGHEDAHVKALVARAASLEAAGAASSSAGLSPRGVFAPPIALARAVGRCATPLAEDALVSWLSARSVYSTPAALGLGDLAVRRKSLRPATVAALVAAAPLPGMDVVFHPLSRVTHGPKEAPAVLTAARAALARPSDERVLVVKTLAKLGPAGASELGAVASATTRYTAAERAEAARGLARLDDAGQGAAAAALLNLVPDQDAAFIASLRGPQIGVLLALIDALGEVSPARAHPVLSALMRLERPAGSKSDPLLSRRIDELRCASALTLALAGYDVSGLVRCAEPGSFVQQRATLKGPCCGAPSTAGARWRSWPWRAHRTSVCARPPSRPSARTRRSATRGVSCSAKRSPATRPVSSPPPPTSWSRTPSAPWSSPRASVTRRSIPAPHLPARLRRRSWIPRSPRRSRAHSRGLGLPIASRRASH